MSFYFDSETLDQMLDFVRYAEGWDNEGKLQATRFHQIILLPFLRKFFDMNSGLTPFDYKELEANIRCFSRTGIFETENVENINSQDILDLVPDSDNQAIWQDFFTQDALLAVETYISHFKESSIDFDTFFSRSVNTFAKFCDEIANTWYPEDPHRFLTDIFHQAQNFNFEDAREIVETLDSKIYR